MKTIWALCFLLITIGMAKSQENLLPNAGFEEYVGCINELSKDSVKFAGHWSNPIDTTLQPESICSEGWAPYLNVKEAYKGKASQYISTFYGVPDNARINFRIYILAKLKKPLIKDNVYFFKMQTRCIYNTPVGFAMTNGQGIAFSENPPKLPDDKGPLNLKALIQSDKIIDTTWTEISGCFKAKGGEEYAIIGNFKPINETLIKKLSEENAKIDPLNPFGNTPNPLIGSYLVDDVELIDLFADIPRDTAICAGESLLLDARNNLQAKYTWQDGTTTPQYKVTKEGTYKVKIEYTIGKDKCTIEQPIKVRVLPKYKAKEHIDTVICSYKDVLLKVGTGRSDDTIVWQDNSRKDTLRATQKGYYEAQITNACGKYAQSFQVKFAHCTFNIFIPNIFTPNGDSQNDVFIPYVKAEFPIVDYEFGVFNRWGIKVFSSKEIGLGWDGFYQNKEAESGVYIWYLKVKGKINERIVEEIEGGDVVLMR